MSELPDSGARTTFDRGAAGREDDPSKSRVDLISPFMIFRLGKHMGAADTKYADIGGARNYEKGMPIMRVLAGIERHVLQYKAREASEDHPAAMAWAAMALVHYETVGAVVDGQRIATFDDLDDRPRWLVGS